MYYCDHDDALDLSAASGDEIRQVAVDHFLTLFADAGFCVSVAPRVTCEEADIISVMIAIHGGAEAARTWNEAHADGDDDPDDWHHLPDIPDDLSGLGELS